MATDSPGEKSTRVKHYAPVDKDYVLTGIDIEEAENGVVICCKYGLTEEAEEKIKKTGQSKYDVLGYNGDREKHVFEDKAEAMKFIDSELDAMWGDTGDEEDE